MRRVLCGTDFSAFAQDAVTLAAHWCARAGAELHLIHVCSAEDPFGLRRERLFHEGNRLAEQGHTPAGLDIVLGDPAEVLLEEAESRGAELIVLGAVGERGIDRWLTGGVTSRVARDASVPVLVARGIHPLQEWLDSGERLRVMTGFERGESTRNALLWASHLSRLGPIDLSVVHLVVPGPENRRAHATGTGLGLTLQPEVEEQLVAELRASVEQVIGMTPVNLMVRSALGRRDVPLVMQAQELHSGLVVVGSHQRHGFQRWWSGSVSHGVLNAATTCVAVVPSRTGAD